MSEPPFFSRRERRSTGLRAEKKAGARLGGRVIPGSGAIASLKGDIELVEFLIESKSTQAASLGVKLEWLEKIALEARERLKHPALIVQFTDGMGEPVKNGSWVMVPSSVFAELVE